MASLQLVSDTYYICVRFAGRRFKRSLKTDRIDRADARCVRLKLVSGSFPRKGVRLPKGNELPPFQTWDEIERQIEQGDLDDAYAATLWDALYLRRHEIDALLKHVQEHASHPFIYPMVVMAAHTGARRAGLMRSQRMDFDLDGGIVTIREKKRVRGCNTTRRVPLSPTLIRSMM